MRIRSLSGRLPPACLLLILAGCVDVTEGRYRPPNCRALCDASVAREDSGGGEADAEPEPEPEIPSQCDCGTADGGQGDAQSNGGDGDLGSGTCSDGAQNGTETDVDCGGTCAPCSTGAQCAVATDCTAPLACSTTMTCVTGPTAGFSLASTTGLFPFNAVATSSAAAGDSAITTTEYHWGDGPRAAFEANATHRYRESGTYSVRQRVTDANGVASESAAQTIVVTDYAVRFSATDKTEEITFTNHRLEVGIANGEGGVRSDSSVAPGSGVFYFEAKQLFVGRATANIGVGTAAAPLTSPLGNSDSAPSLGASAGGLARGAFACTGSNYGQQELGFVIDYRAASPTVYIVTDNGGVPDIGATCSAPSVTAPLFIMFVGSRDHIGPALRINTGADTTNHPFHFPTDGVRAALTTAGQAAAAAALVPGFGRTRAAPADAAPVVNVTASATTVAIGTPVTLTASATDAVDGTLTSDIRWTDVSSQFWSRANGVGVGTGPTYSFTPDRIGRFPIEASVTDSAETTTTVRTMIVVTGALPQPNPVRLEQDEFSNPSIVLSGNGLGATFVDNGKNGIRANQGLYGQFWYFEAHRDTAEPSNLGVGIVIKKGNLSHYDFRDVPWSCSLNMSQSIWRNLISKAPYDTAFNHYGFAVDYRGEHPIVYVLVNNAVVHKMVLDDVWEPVYPMLYGNPTSDPAATDSSINFGATPFVFTPAAALGATDGAGLELGWGDAYTPH